MNRDYVVAAFPFRLRPVGYAATSRVRLDTPDKLACQDEVRRFAANEDWR